MRLMSSKKTGTNDGSKSGSGSENSELLPFTLPKNEAHVNMVQYFRNFKGIFSNSSIN